jgi:hypothetical protein
MASGAKATQIDPFPVLFAIFDTISMVFHGDFKKELGDFNPLMV